MKNLVKLSFLVLVLQTQFAKSQTIEKWSLDDLKTAIEKAEQPIVLNFWATFCKPCLAEMPHFQELAKKYETAGLRMFFVSVDLPEDYPHRIQTFVKRLRITSPVSFLNETNADKFCPVVDPSWSGAIPATLLINNKTGYRKFFEEEIKKEKLEALIQELLAASSKD